MSPQEATNLLPHAARACCGPVLEALIRQGADLNSFNFQRGALTAGGAPFAIVAKKVRPRLLKADARVRRRRPERHRRSMGWSALHILCLCRLGRGNSTEAWHEDDEVRPRDGRSHKARQHGDVIESVRVMLEAGADPTLQTSRQL